MAREITVKTKVPTISGKETTLTLEGDEVQIRPPVSFKIERIKLDDLAAGVRELREASEAVGG